MEKDEDVATPLGMVDDDYWPATRSRTDSVERRWLQESVKARQGLYLRNKLLPNPDHPKAFVVVPRAGQIVPSIRCRRLRYIHCRLMGRRK